MAPQVDVWMEYGMGNTIQDHHQLVSTRDGGYQLFRIDTIPIRYQGFLVVSIPNFDSDTSKFEPYSSVLL